ncbi:MAG: helix-turn-helix transcriptional regulator [Acidobacteriota bacterium]|jgi:DNA-binding PadR family transcriptional regulator
MATRQPAAEGPLKPHILLILMALMNGRTHGYEIRNEVERLSEGDVRLDPGTLYRHLGRLLDEGLIAESDDRPEDDDPRRRYYVLTDTGAAALEAEAERMEALAAAVRASELARARSAQ